MRISDWGSDVCSSDLIALAFTIAHPDRVERAVLMGPAGLEFPITPALDEVWGYVPSVEAMRSSLEYLAWDHSRLTDDLIKSRYEARDRKSTRLNSSH